MAKLVLPIDPFQLTQEFGGNPQAYAQFGLKGHNGWDIRTIYPDTPLGRKNILMPQDGQFFGAGDEGNGGYGKYFEITTKTSKSIWKHTFAHCHSIEKFTEKKQGESPAISNNTGNSSASHLHWTVKRMGVNPNGSLYVLDYNNGYFGAVNPQEYVNEVRADLEVNPNPPMNDKREHWFDLMSKVIFGEDVGWEKLTQEDIEKWVKEYPNQKEGNGKWSGICNKAFGEGTDSNVKTVDEVYEKLTEVDVEAIKEEGRLLGIEQAKEAVNKLA